MYQFIFIKNSEVKKNENLGKIKIQNKFYTK